MNEEQDSGFVCVFRRKNQLFIQPHNRADTGAWLAREDIVTLDTEVTDTALGEAVIAKVTTTQVVPYKIPGDGALLVAAGIKSIHTFNRIASMVGVSFYKGETKVSPRRRDGGGWTSFDDARDDPETFVGLPRPEVLGAAIRAAFKRGEQKPGQG